MAQYSPELIEQTISVFKRRNDGELSLEEARQAVENISGFFQILQEWAEAEAKGDCGDTPANSEVDERAAQ